LPEGKGSFFCRILLVVGVGVVGVSFLFCTLCADLRTSALACLPSTTSTSTDSSVKTVTTSATTRHLLTRVQCILLLPRRIRTAATNRRLLSHHLARSRACCRLQSREERLATKRKCLDPRRGNPSRRYMKRWVRSNPFRIPAPHRRQFHQQQQRLTNIHHPLRLLLLPTHE
jgi:hypothetical protein